MRKMIIILAVVLILGLLTTAVSYASPPAYGPIYHYVRYGETLSSIGRLYGVNPYAIARANGLANPNYIYAGQVLLISTCYSPYYYSGCYSYPCYPSCYPYYYCWSSYYLDP